MMTPGFLVEQCTITTSGEGALLAVEAPTAGRMVQLTLGITNASEQSSLDVSIYTSADGETWSGQAAVTFPQRFYKGVAALLLNVEDGSNDGSKVKYLRAKWKVSRWGRGSLTPEFGIYIFAEELP